MQMTLIRAPFILGVLLTASGFAAAQDAGPRPRTISVTGTAEVTVAPDEAILVLGIESHDKDLAAARLQNDARVKKLITSAEETGIESKHVQTSALTMGPEYSDERIPKFLGFKVSQTLVLDLTDISKYEAVMTKVLQAGVNRVDGIRFVVADPKKYRDEARAKALRLAREKAVAMAAELGQTIGKPLEIVESPEYESPYSQSNAQYAVNAFTPAQPEESAVASGEVSIRASVRVTFQLE